MPSRWKRNTLLLEQGDIYFFYKPKKGLETVTGINQVGRFYFVLAPNNGEYRFLVMATKNLPRLEGQGSTAWGLVQFVGGQGYKTLPNSPVNPKGARPAGEGIYSLIGHRGHTHLLYALELPRKRGQVQVAFNVYRQGNYIFLVRPPGTGTNFLAATPELLNQKASQLRLIGISTDVGQLGYHAEIDQETKETADVFTRLLVKEDRHPSTPLIKGSWE